VVENYYWDDIEGRLAIGLLESNVQFVSLRRNRLTVLSSPFLAQMIAHLVPKKFEKEDITSPIRRFDLSENDLRVAGLNFFLKSMAKLIQVFWQSQGIELVAAELGKNTNLVELNVSDNKMDGNGLLMLSDALVS
jgi:hypothetical protein